MGQLWSDPSNDTQPGKLHNAIKRNDINEVFRLLDTGISVCYLHIHIYHTF